MATELHVVTGDQYRTIDRRMREIKRQLDQDSGSPLDPNVVAIALQQIVEGCFINQIEFPVTIYYSQSLANMIAAGLYDSVDSRITADNFPVMGTGTVERTLFLILFNRSMSSEAVVKELNSQGLQPATIEELLAFGAIYPNYPNKQWGVPIICLGSVWTDPRSRRSSVPSLYRDGSQRLLNLDWFDLGWYGACHFLAVRK